MAAANPNYDEILTTTLANYRPTLEDNVFSHRPLSAKLAGDGKIKFKSGGAKIVIPLLTGENSTAKPYGKYATLDITPQEGMSAAEFDWRAYSASVAIAGIEEAMNDGEEEVIDLLEGKVMQAEETIKEDVDEFLFLGTGFSKGLAGDRWLGLADIVGTGTLGGINPATAGNEFWKATIKDSATAVRNDDDWTNAFNTGSKGNDRPEFGVTTQVLYEHYEASLAPALRLSSNKEADARFEHLLFKGRPLFFDEYCQSGTTYFLNGKYLYLVGHKKNWFRNTPFQKPVDKDARYSQIICYGQLVCSNRERQVKVINQTV